MQRNRLTARAVAAATAPGKYGDGAGLTLVVRPDGRRDWRLRFMVAGRAREMGLGGAADVTLAEARAAAAKARALIAAGQDPIDARRAETGVQTAARARTFAQVAEAWLAAHESSYRNAKHRAQVRTTLAVYAFPTLGAMPVAAVTTGDVLAVLRPVWQRAPETASRLRGRIEAVLSYAKALGWRDGQNPAAWRDNLDHLLPATGRVARVRHHAALPWQDMGAFWGALAPERGIGAAALRFTILTAARSGETRGATWAEIDLAGAIWTVPGERMKAGREHRVPLSDAAVAVLRAIAPFRQNDRPDALVFPGARRGGPLSDMSLTAVLRRMGRRDLTVHGFRSTFRDWAAEATAFPRDVAEAALAHTLRDKVEAAYRRGDMLDKRRRLMAAWADYCAQTGGDAEAVNVTPIRRAAVGA